jgi:hypothetical protein
MSKLSIDPPRLANEVKQWLASADGQQASRETLVIVEKVTTELEKARRVDEKTLHQPFTI